MDISSAVCFLCVFVRISPLRISLAVSNFAWWFIGALGRVSPILGSFAPQKPKMQVCNSYVGLIVCVAHALADSFGALDTHRFGMCG